MVHLYIFYLPKRLIMKKSGLFILVGCCLMVSFLIVGCSEAADDDAVLGTGIENADERAFFNNLAKFCGQSFNGLEVFVGEGLEGQAPDGFTVSFALCEDNRIEIPVEFGDGEKRSWNFFEEEGRLRFYHDHRHQDGTPYEGNLYGGYACGGGSPLYQEFPADEHTVEVRPHTEGFVWRIELTEGLTTLVYSLLGEDEPYFIIEVDLENPLDG